MCGCEFSGLKPQVLKTTKEFDVFGFINAQLVKKGMEIIKKILKR